MVPITQTLDIHRREEMEKDSRDLYVTKSQQYGQKESPFQESWKGGQCLGHSTYHPEAGSVKVVSIWILIIPILWFCS